MRWRAGRRAGPRAGKGGQAVATVAAHPSPSASRTLALAWPLLLAVLFLTAREPVSTAVAGAATADDAAAPRFEAQLRGLPQPTTVTATPRLRLPTDTPAPGAAAGATGTMVRVSITAAPRLSVTPTGAARSGEAETPDASDAAGTPSAAPGSAAGGTDPGSTAGDGGGAVGGSPGPAGGTPPQGASDAGPPGRSGDSRATTDGEADRAMAPSGLLSAPATDPGIRRLWAATGSPRAGQSWLARLTADRPGPWGWGLTYPLLALAFLWAFWHAWRSLGDRGDADAARVADGEGRG